MKSDDDAIRDALAQLAAIREQAEAIGAADMVAEAERLAGEVASFRVEMRAVTTAGRKLRAQAQSGIPRRKMVKRAKALDARLAGLEPRYERLGADLVALRARL